MDPDAIRHCRHMSLIHLSLSPPSTELPNFPFIMHGERAVVSKPALNTTVSPE